jgi:hypothetical protein
MNVEVMGSTPTYGMLYLRAKKLKLKGRCGPKSG